MSTQAHKREPDRKWVEIVHVLSYDGDREVVRICKSSRPAHFVVIYESPTEFESDLVSLQQIEQKFGGSAAMLLR